MKPTPGLAARVFLLHAAACCDHPCGRSRERPKGWGLFFPHCSSLALQLLGGKWSQGGHGGLLWAMSPRPCPLAIAHAGGARQPVTGQGLAPSVGLGRRVLPVGGSSTFLSGGGPEEPLEKAASQVEETGWISVGLAVSSFCLQSAAACDKQRIFLTDNGSRAKQPDLWEPQGLVWPLLMLARLMESLPCRDTLCPPSQRVAPARALLRWVTCYF